MLYLSLAIGFVLGVAAMYALGMYGARCYTKAMIETHPAQASFMQYLDDNPQLRFWQGLANWSDCHIFAAPENVVIEQPTVDVLLSNRFVDTWEWKDRQHPTVQEW